MSLTQDCLITHIKNIQCLYKDLANKYVDKLKIGKVCKEAETSLLIVDEYLESFYCFKVPLEYINKYRIQVLFSGDSNSGNQYEITNVEFDLVSDSDIFHVNLGSNIYSSLGDGGVSARNQMLIDIASYLTTLGVTITENTPPYIYFESTETIWEGIASGTVTNLTFTVINDGPSDTFGVGIIDDGSVPQSLVIENCLTTDEICCMISHTYKLLKDCNC